METRLAVISMIIENLESSETINRILHEHSSYVRGRMGVPCRDKGVSVMCVVLEAAPEVVSGLSGKLGMLPGVAVKTIVHKSTGN